MKEDVLKEIWKPIKEYEKLYEVSNFGNVRSIKRQGTKGNILKFGKRKDGYLQVYLYKNGKGKNFLVHRVVMESFFKKNNLLDINHKDENKTNNKLENLEYCTKKYNMNYGNRPYKNAKKVNQYDLNNNIIKMWKSIREASRNTNINQSHIVTGGFIWRYVDER